MKKQTTEYEKKAWKLVILCWLAYTTVYIGKKTLNHCLPGMILEGVCTKDTGGPIGSCFLACYACGQFVNGWLGEKLHPRHMICIGLFCAGLMNILMSITSSVPLFMLIWGACGLFCSMLWAPIIRAVSEWTTEEISHASAASLSVTIPVGTIGCTLICAAALRISGWRLAFFCCGAVLCVLAVVYAVSFASIREHMSDAGKPPKAAESADSSKSAEAPAAPAKVTVFCAGLVMAAVGILFNGMIKDGLDQWIPTLLNQRFISNESVASLICTILPIVNIFGAYVAKWMLAKGMSEMGVCAAMFGVSAASLGVVLVFLHFSGGGVLAAILVTLLLSLSSSSMLGANTMLLTFIPLHYGKIGRASAVTGTLNGFSYAAAAVSAMVVGWIEGWETVFLVFLAAAVLGVLACFFGKGMLQKKLDELDRL